MISSCATAGTTVRRSIPTRACSRSRPRCAAIQYRFAGTGRIRDRTFQVTEGGLEVLLGARGPDQAIGLGPLWSPLARALAEADRPVFADCGRIGPASPTMPVLMVADAVIMVARAELEELSHLRERLRFLTATLPSRYSGRARVGVILVASERDRAAGPRTEQLLRSSGLAVSVLGTIADDARGAPGQAARPPRRPRGGRRWSGPCGRCCRPSGSSPGMFPRWPAAGAHRSRNRLMNPELSTSPRSTTSPSRTTSPNGAREPGHRRFPGLGEGLNSRIRCSAGRRSRPLPYVPVLNRYRSLKMCPSRRFSRSPGRRGTGEESMPARPRAASGGRWAGPARRTLGDIPAAGSGYWGGRRPAERRG